MQGRQFKAGPWPCGASGVESRGRGKFAAGCRCVIGRRETPPASSRKVGALAAALIAQRLGLPGAEPSSLLRALHKFEVRVRLHDIAFITRLVDPHDQALKRFPQSRVRGIDTYERVCEPFGWPAPH